MLSDAIRRLEEHPDLVPDSLVSNADRHRHRMEAPPLGEVLIERDLISRDQLEGALEIQRITRQRLGDVLIEEGLVSSVDLTRAVADRIGFAFVDLDTHPHVFGGLLPEAVARRHVVLPIGRRRGSIVVAMANPDDVVALDDLRLRLGVGVIPVMADMAQLSRAIDEVYETSAVRDSVEQATTSVSDELDELPEIGADQGPIVRLVDALLDEAASDRASDIHIEPGADGVKMRFRIDGVLHDISTAPASVLRPVLSRIKVLAGLDITQSRLPQDGRFTQAIGADEVDVRVATIPTVYGETAVLRLLDQSQRVVDLGQLGIEPGQLERYERAFRSQQGAILITGPTGSGKTSTVYATISALDARDRNVMSIEDPVEYKLRGVKQVQVDNKTGMTFPRALRSILRCDPDILLIGEIRDGETAEIAAGAAMTGHLVFSTMHTTSAAAAPARFIEMGVEPYIVSSALTCVVAQRLARRLCERCTQPLKTDVAVLTQLGADERDLETAHMRHPVGCDECHNTGYFGRIGLYEVLTITDSIRDLIIRRARAQDIEACAIEEGMETLRRGGLAHVLAGRMGIEELLRVTS